MLLMEALPNYLFNKYEQVSYLCNKYQQVHQFLNGLSHFVLFLFKEN